MDTNTSNTPDGAAVNLNPNTPASAARNAPAGPALSKADPIAPPASNAPAPKITDAERKRIAHERALNEAKPLGAADIVRVRPPRVEWVLVPNLGGKVLVRALSGTERDEFESSLVQQRGKERKITTANIRAKLCALAIVDPMFYEMNNGEVRRAFTDEQIAQLGAVDAGELSKIYDKAAELSGITEADVEELAGNSAPTVSGVS